MAFARSRRHHTIFEVVLVETLHFFARKDYLQPWLNPENPKNGKRVPWRVFRPKTRSFSATEVAFRGVVSAVVVGMLFWSVSETKLERLAATSRERDHCRKLGSPETPRLIVIPFTHFLNCCLQEKVQ